MALHGHTCGIRAAVPRRLCWSDKFTLEGERMTGQFEDKTSPKHIYLYKCFIYAYYLYFNANAFP